ncbi:MAG: hypothetical protein ACK40S_00190 [Burkholderiaceae bacterium]
MDNERAAVVVAGVGGAAAWQSGPPMPQPHATAAFSTALGVLCSVMAGVASA